MWISTLIASWWAASSYFSESNSAANQLTRFFMESRTRVEVRFEQPSVVQIGDPVIWYENDIARPIGRVIDIHGGPTAEVLPVIANKATVEFFSSSPPISADDFLAYHSTPESVEWMVQMMLPARIREQIGSLILTAYREHNTEISELLQPIVAQTAKDAAGVIREEFQASIKRHDKKIRRLGEKYQKDLVDKKLIPMIQDEIWPIVRQEAEPLATDIGRDLWAEVSMWRFGWRMVYDRSPLPQRNLVEKEFQRFLQKQGAPILKKRIPDLVDLQQKILSRVSGNEEVREVVGATATQILKDADFQELAAEILRDVFVNNERLMSSFQENWETEEARAAMEVTNRRLDPTITAIGQTLFGDPENSITPEFSRVLRHRILHKDNRWLVLQKSTNDDGTASENPSHLRVVAGMTGTENPFHVPKSD